MISQDKYLSILSMGLNLDHYYILHLLANKKDVPRHKKVEGIITILLRKKLINPDHSVTQEGMAILSEKKNDNFELWTLELHKKCQEKLQSLTGKTQIRDKINNVPYSFLPNKTDFTRVLRKVINEYKLTDLNRIEECIMNFIESRYKAKSWFPILQYYIMKDKQSRLVTDYESEKVYDKGIQQSSQKFL